MSYSSSWDEALRMVQRHQRELSSVSDTVAWVQRNRSSWDAALAEADRFQDLASRIGESQRLLQELSRAPIVQPWSRTATALASLRTFAHSRALWDSAVVYVDGAEADELALGDDRLLADDLVPQEVAEESAPDELEVWRWWCSLTKGERLAVLGGFWLAVLLTLSCLARLASQSGEYAYVADLLGDVRTLSNSAAFFAFVAEARRATDAVSP